MTAKFEKGATANMFSSLDTRGGHVVTCLILLGIAAAFYQFHIPKADDIIVFTLGVLARSMHGNEYSATQPPNLPPGSTSEVNINTTTKTETEPTA